MAILEGISLDKMNIVQSQNEWIGTWDGVWAVLKEDDTTASITLRSAIETSSSNVHTAEAASLPTGTRNWDRCWSWRFSTHRNCISSLVAGEAC